MIFEFNSVQDRFDNRRYRHCHSHNDPFACFVRGLPPSTTEEGPIFPAPYNNFREPALLLQSTTSISNSYKMSCLVYIYIYNKLIFVRKPTPYRFYQMIVWDLGEEMMYHMCPYVMVDVVYPSIIAIKCR